MPKILCVTRAVLVEKFKVNGSIARSLIQELASRGDIKRVGDAHHSFDLFTGTKAKSAAEKEKEELAAKEAKEKKGKKEWTPFIKSATSGYFFLKLITPTQSCRLHFDLFLFSFSFSISLFIININLDLTKSNYKSLLKH